VYILKKNQKKTRKPKLNRFISI